MTVSRDQVNSIIEFCRINSDIFEFISADMDAGTGFFFVEPEVFFEKYKHTHGWAIIFRVKSQAIGIRLQNFGIGYTGSVDFVGLAADLDFSAFFNMLNNEAKKRIAYHLDIFAGT
jgi:hypothetical protein